MQETSISQPISLSTFTLLSFCDWSFKILLWIWQIGSKPSNSDSFEKRINVIKEVVHLCQCQIRHCGIDLSFLNEGIPSWLTNQNTANPCDIIMKLIFRLKQTHYRNVRYLMKVCFVKTYPIDYYAGMNNSKILIFHFCAGLQTGFVYICFIYTAVSRANGNM